MSGNLKNKEEFYLFYREFVAGERLEVRRLVGGWFRGLGRRFWRSLGSEVDVYKICFVSRLERILRSCMLNLREREV